MVFKGIFIENGCCCLIMEYCSGGDLEKILKEKKRIPQKVRNNYYLLFLYIYIKGIS
jgi:serine/threonine protein kinase